MHLHLWHFDESRCKHSFLKCEDVCSWYSFLFISFHSFSFYPFPFYFAKVKIPAFGLSALVVLRDSRFSFINYFLSEFFFLLSRGFHLFFVRANSSFFSRKIGPFFSNFSSFTVIVLFCLYLLSRFTNHDFKRPI